MNKPPLHSLAAKERQNYLLWLQAQERKAEKLALPLSSWYRGPLLDAYTRVTRYLPALKGSLAICFANIEVAEEYRGQGFLTQLLAALALPGLPLKAEFLYFENVLNPRLQAWLPSVGFELYPSSGEMSPCYFRRRVVAKAVLAGLPGTKRVRQ